MFSKNYLNISAFAKLSGLSRQTLIYYDKIGLFSPAVVAENKYRTYSHKQIDVINIISILRDLDVPLKKIKSFLADISPEKTGEALNYQLGVINDKIQKLCDLRDMTEIRLEQIKLGQKNGAGQANFLVKTIEEPIYYYCGKQLDCLADKIPDDDVVEFFEQAEKTGVPLIFAFGHIKSAKSVLAGEAGVISRFCFRVKGQKFANGFMPAGKYIIGYARGDYGKTDYIYAELLRYAEVNGLKLCGNIYEEYLIDELAEKNPERFVLQISAAVE